MASHSENCCILSSLSTLKALNWRRFVFSFFLEGRPVAAYRVCWVIAAGARNRGIEVGIIGLTGVVMLSLASDARHWFTAAISRGRSRLKLCALLNEAQNAWS